MMLREVMIAAAKAGVPPIVHFESTNDGAVKVRLDRYTSDLAQIRDTWGTIIETLDGIDDRMSEFARGTWGIIAQYPDDPLGSYPMTGRQVERDYGDHYTEILRGAADEAWQEFVEVLGKEASAHA